MARFVTVLEAHVAHDAVARVAQAYAAELSSPPPEVHESYLVRSLTNPELLRVINVWVSREAMQRTETTGRIREEMAVLEAVGARPTLHEYEILGHGVPVSGPGE